jgi:hypothetical protein
VFCSPARRRLGQRPLCIPVREGDGVERHALRDRSRPAVVGAHGTPRLGDTARAGGLHSGISRAESDARHLAVASTEQEDSHRLYMMTHLRREPLDARVLSHLRDPCQVDEVRFPVATATRSSRQTTAARATAGSGPTPGAASA